MKSIDELLLDMEFQRSVLKLLEKKHPGGALACEISSISDFSPEKTYTNIRYLEIKGYISKHRLHSIGSNYFPEMDMIFQITPEGRRFLNII